MLRNKHNICILTAILVVTVSTSLCQAATWQQVTAFAGREQYTTDYFYIPTTEWKITWDYTPTSEYPVFNFFAYEKGKGALYTTMVYATKDQTQGTTYVHEGTAHYYLTINAANCNYNIKIEYETTTNAHTPTFKPSTNTEIDYRITQFIIIGAIFLAVSISTVLIINHRRRKNLKIPEYPR